MKDYKCQKRIRDKSQISTVDKVLDLKTLSILNSLQKRGKLIELTGCLCSGKEANVYTGKCSIELKSKYTFDRLLNDTEILNDKEILNDTEILNEDIRNLSKRLNGILSNDDNDNDNNEHNIITNDIIDFNNNFVNCAIKIYKTSTMLFKDRIKYIVNEKRFGTFCSGNSRKLTKLWSQKEVRNLKRMKKYGIKCPEPLYLKGSVLIMELIHDDLSDKPSKRLKDVKNTIDKITCNNIDDNKIYNNITGNITTGNITTDDNTHINADNNTHIATNIISNLYSQSIQILSDLYKKAGLVHADFSEYNLLVKNENEIFVIDVGQSVEKGHENALIFLITDIININEFFRSRKVKVRNENEIFTEITDLKIPEYLKNIKLNRESFIPSNLSEISNIEDVKLFISSIDSLSGSSSTECLLDNTSTESLSESSNKDNSLEDDYFSVESSLSTFENTTKIERLKPNNKADNKLRKKQVKEENKERRIKRVERKEIEKKKNRNKKKSRHSRVR